MTAINPKLVTTAFELPGLPHRAERRHRARHRRPLAQHRRHDRRVAADAGRRNITLFTQMCERAREDAFQLMLDHAAEHGANALVGVRYDANEVAAGVTEVLAYGTAVVVESVEAR